MSGYRPKKRFDQNFLVDDGVIDRIVGLVAPRPGEDIVEIGPGRGALTGLLLTSGGCLSAVELDRDLARWLGDEFEDLEVINTDVLSFEWSDRFPSRYKLVGNLPYSITTPVIDRVVVNRDRIVSAVLMMQREVAARLTSSPGQKDWSPLAIFCQVHFDVDRAFDVPPDSFDPPPEVTSSVVKLTRRESIPLSHPRAFESLVRASFRQRRKQLVNNLVPQLTQDSTALRAELEQLGLPASVRAEEISLARFADLTRALVERGLLADA